MLVLSRGPQDKIVFPNLGITVEILRVDGHRVRVGVDAPKDIRILRHELTDTLNGELQSEAKLKADSARIHDFRNRLNSAQLSLSLMEKQLDRGMHEDALASLHTAIHEIDLLDGNAAVSCKNGSAEEAEARANPVPRALLVEDDSNECELLAGYLRMSGYEVETAQDGLQAMVQLARRDRPDVVLLDMHMPRMDGPKTVKSIRLNPDYRGVKVFAVTGSQPEEMDVEIGPRGVDRWFLKPIRPQELVDSLNDELLCAAKVH
ncbi:response regulator [Bythopirellula polymerisocia]|uniref:Translational regulator CsrA n=1 Tax=Bythopirellula polymerisocia TaxID=2528003 RepID=A0A5C6CZ79_9BACT|nr:response regulator [Bythopirellula polymerisocia]TWU29942.1 DNA-binding response regulator MtrA [Bythopirellula polymerisocia]